VLVLVPLVVVGALLCAAVTEQVFSSRTSGATWSNSDTSVPMRRSRCSQKHQGPGTRSTGQQQQLANQGECQVHLQQHYSDKVISYHDLLPFPAAAAAEAEAAAMGMGQLTGSSMSLGPQQRRCQRSRLRSVQQPWLKLSARSGLRG